MGGSILYPHSVPSFTRSQFRNPTFSLKEIADRPFVLGVRADGNRRDRPQKDSDPQPVDSGRSPMSSNKEEILALFKRIQSSISKGDSLSSKKRNSKLAAAEDKPSAESILEVLHQSRTRGKEKTLGKKVDKLLVSKKESLKKEERAEKSSPKTEERTESSPEIGLKSTRPPSNFTRRSPIPPLSSPRENVEPKNETSPITADDNEQQSKKFEEMKLAELKEAAKSKGLKGYSKLKKSELVELLLRS